MLGWLMHRHLGHWRPCSPSATLPSQSRGNLIPLPPCSGFPALLCYSTDETGSSANKILWWLQPARCSLRVRA